MASLTDNAKQVTDSYKIVLSSPGGRLVLADLMQEFVLGAKFESDPYVNAYRSGQRDLVLKICNMVYEDTDKLLGYVERMQEGVKTD